MLNKLKVGQRLFVLVVLSATITIAVAVFGAYGMRTIEAHMDNTYQNSVLPLLEIEKVDTLLADTDTEIFRALQHAPSAKISETHFDHPHTVHFG